MQQVKLDKGKAYGQVCGHPDALYEQDGKLFNGIGELVEPELVDEHEEISAKDFLKDLLSGGPVSQSNVHKAAESGKQQWDDVKQASIELNVKKYQYKGVTSWKL